MAFSSIRPPVGFSAFAVLGVILVSLHLMSSATQDSSGLGQAYSWLLLANTVATVIMAVLVGANVHSLFRQLKKKEAGSRLTARMVFLFVLLALAPATIVFYYSVQFLHGTIDSWFDVQIDQAMDDALELSRASLDQRMKSHLRDTQQVAKALANVPDEMIAVELGELRETLEASELTLISIQERIIAYSSLIPDILIPSLPTETVFLQLERGEDYVGLDPILNEAMQVRVVIGLALPEPRFLQALFPVPVRLSSLARTVEDAYVHYKEMSYLRNSLKWSFSLTLSLVLLLSLLAAIWVAFVSTRRIVAPVRDLAQGTRAVAEGDYEQRLPVESRDELGFLVESFNDMTAKVGVARDEAARSQFEVENQRAYLETVLGNLTTGVLSFDASDRLRTFNQAAGKILHVDLQNYSEQPLAALAVENPNLENFVTLLKAQQQTAKSYWQEEVAFTGPDGRQQLLCRGTPLFNALGRRLGTVMVFDDMTDLFRAQRNATWADVAQRMAHEIKNPLTPIQLSAERLQHKLWEKLDAKDGDVLERATQTIIHQVEALKTMVNAFSEYARPPKIQPEEVNINSLIEDVLMLYQPNADISFKLMLAPDLPGVMVDPFRMRQVLNNLIKNAIEALSETPNAKIVIATNMLPEEGFRFVQIAIYDNGPGITQVDIEHIFDPYVTTKVKGTGLGLAIVKKFIEEHGGTIRSENSYQGGAGFVIRLPGAVTDAKVDKELVQHQ